MASGHGNHPVHKSGDHGHHADHAHAGPKLYWIFAVILCVITFIEWAIFKKKEALGISNNLMIGTLLILSLVKFVMVCGWYMHLRFDSKVLTNVFVFSGLLALAVFVMMRLSLPVMG
jgi:heme/copper-type cytochrome/quinol oxidase subunit 4